MADFIPEGMSVQAQQIWTMLDDMAENDPAAYRKFIERQMKEGKEELAPPDPHMCVQVTLLSKPPRPLFVNFLMWKRVPEPKTPDDPVPVSGAPITEEKDEKGEFSLTSVAFNPRVLEEFGRKCKNSADADTLVQLALDYIEHEQRVKVARTYTVLPETTPLKGQLELVRLCFTKAFQRQSKGGAGGARGDGGRTGFEKDVSELEKTFGPLSSSERDSLLSQLANISTGTTDASSDASSRDYSSSLPGNGSHTLGASGTGQSDIRIPGLSSQNLTQPGSNRGGQSSGLIQEISEDNLSTTPPKYTLETSKATDGGRQLVLKVQLPGVKSVSECELDISEDDVKLVVPGCHDWCVKLPACVDKDEARARFSKKASQLTLTMPVKT